MRAGEGIRYSFVFDGGRTGRGSGLGSVRGVVGERWFGPTVYNTINVERKRSMNAYRDRAVEAWGRGEDSGEQSCASLAE